MAKLNKNLLVSIPLALVLVGCSSSSKKEAAKDSVELSDDGDQKSQKPSAAHANAEPQQESATGRQLSKQEYQALSQAIKSGQDESIHQEAIKLLQINSQDPVALNALAMSYLKRGKPGAARLLMEKSIEKNGPTAAALNNLGILDLSENEPEAALQNFKKALKAQDSPEASANLGSLYLQGGDYAKALPLLEQAHKAFKSDIGISNNYAVALRGTKSLDAAQKVYEEIMQQNSRDVNTLLNYAILLIDYLNKPKDGLALVNKVKFLETERKEIVSRANTLEKKAKSELK